MQEANDLIKKFFIKNLDLKKLKIKDDFHWQIVCDIFLIGNLFLNELDYIVKGIRYCLQSCSFPKVQIHTNNWTQEITYDVLGESELLFEKDSIPQLFIVGYQKNSNKAEIILDMNREELECCDSYYLVAYDSKGNLKDLEKLDGKIVDVNTVGSFIQQAIFLGKEISKMTN